MSKAIELVAKIQEHGDHIYITQPVTLYAPEAADIETFAFAQNFKALAPNPHITWLRGQYVEADNANQNGDMWRADDLAIKKLTPVFMPVTVMHDFRSNVGTIVDAALRTPNADSVPRSRIETVLALWAHRFPEIAEEARINAEQGTLMQSMECISPAYDCSACGQMFHRLPGMAERDTWCAHLRGQELDGEGRAAARILRNVVFTGTGLIFGTRGAKGAYPEAHLEVEELAALHREAHSSTAVATKRPRRKNFMEIEDSKYQELVATAETRKSKIEELEAKLATAEKSAEDSEAAKVKAEEQSATEKKRADEAEEKARVATLRDERIEKLGTGFKAKLAKLETTQKRVTEQAGTLSEDEWEARLAELEETLSVKRDADAEGGDGEGEGKGGSKEETAGLFSAEEVTASRVGDGGESDNGGTPALAEPAPESTRTVIAGLAGLGGKK